MYLTLTINVPVWNEELNARDHVDRDVIVNMDLVRYIEESFDDETKIGNGSLLVFGKYDAYGSDDLKVEESPGAIRAKIKRYHEENRNV